MNNNKNLKPEKLENARVKYQGAINLCTSEGQIQWSRYSAMLIVNTIFIGLIGFTYNKGFDFPDFFQLIFQFIPILGLFLCCLWYRMTDRGFIWMNHWITEANEIESQISSKTNPIKNGDKLRSKIGSGVTRNASFWIIKIIALIYFLILVGNVSVMGRS